MQRYKEMRLSQLRAFCECVRHKSFSAAARALQLSQPTVWEQVRALERDCGVSLLQRHGRQWLPSEDGLLFLELASSIVASTDSLQETFRQRQAELPRTLTVVGSPAIMAEDLARPAVEFCRRYPQIRLQMLNYLSTPVFESVSSGEVDMAVLPRRRVEDAGPQLKIEPLSKRPAALVVPKKHPLANKRQITLADVVRYPLILPAADSGWRNDIDDVFRRAGLLDRVHVLLEVSFTHAARRYVNRGLGIALLPLPADPIDFPNIVVRLVENLFPPEEIVILWRRGANPRTQARLFADFTRERLRRAEK